MKKADPITSLGIAIEKLVTGPTDFHPEKTNDTYSCRLIFRGPESMEIYECPILFDGHSFRQQIEEKQPETIQWMLLTALKNCYKEIKK